MITVKDAGALKGYTGVDHLIEDSECHEIIGRQFRCVRDALRAAERRCWIAAYSGHPRRRHFLAYVEVLFADGTTGRFSSV